jgi:hypothetical protein
MKRAAVSAVVTAMSVALWAHPGLAQTSDDLGALRRDVEILKQGQTAIQRDLAEIRRLLQARPPAAAAAPPREVVLGIEGAPSKGMATAKVTLVEFTDYQ